MQKLKCIVHFIKVLKKHKCVTNDHEYNYFIVSRDELFVLESTLRSFEELE